MGDVVVDSAGPIGTVRLNRPHRGNSVTPEVVTRLGDAVEELVETDDVDAVVLTGTGKVFCAGADVNEMYLVYQASGVDGLCGYLAEAWMPAVQRAVRRIWSARKPVIAAFNGAATAGGLDFGLACDVRIASTGARFAESYVNLGMIPVAGGTFLLPLVLGMSRATELLASGDFVDAERALEIGLVDHVCPPSELDHRAREVAVKLTMGPAATFARLKQVVRSSATVDLDQFLTASLEANVALIARPDVRERIVAVMRRYADPAGGSA